MLAKLGEVTNEVAVLKLDVVQDNVASPSPLNNIATKIDVPKTSSYKGSRNAKDIENFIWSLQQYFRALGIIDNALKIDHASLYLADTQWFGGEGDILIFKRGHVPLLLGKNSREN